jgi:hypothetical protein
LLRHLTTLSADEPIERGIQLFEGLEIRVQAVFHGK